jgi:hypothetical protein
MTEREVMRKRGLIDRHGEKQEARKAAFDAQKA